MNIEAPASKQSQDMTQLTVKQQHGVALLRFRASLHNRGSLRRLGRLKAPAVHAVLRNYVCIYAAVVLSPFTQWVGSCVSHFLQRPPSGTANSTMEVMTEMMHTCRAVAASLVPLQKIEVAGILITY
jgi:hypothetical protein